MHHLKKLNVVRPFTTIGFLLLSHVTIILKGISMLVAFESGKGSGKRPGTASSCLYHNN